MEEKADCIEIGAGVVGLAIARSMALSSREVLIPESEPFYRMSRAWGNM